MYSIDLTNKIKNGKIEFTEYENLLLNMLSGLEYKHLTEDEKKLLAENGYTHRD